MADDVALLALHAPRLSESFRLEMPPEPRQLSSMRALLRRWLNHADATDEDVAEILAGVGEASANAIEHAGLTPRQVFTLEGTVVDGEVELKITDPAAGAPPARRAAGAGCRSCASSWTAST